MQSRGRGPWGMGIPLVTAFFLVVIGERVHVLVLMLMLNLRLELLDIITTTTV